MQPDVVSTVPYSEARRRVREPVQDSRRNRNRYRNRYRSLDGRANSTGSVRTGDRFGSIPIPIPIPTATFGMEPTLQDSEQARAPAFGRSRSFAGSGGFTLIEMLISVTLIALMALALWAVLRIAITSWQRGTQFIDDNQRHRATLDLVEKQLASVYPLVPPIDLQSGAGFNPNPIFAGTESSMQFISLCSLRFRDNPGMTMVSYEVVPGATGDYELVEKESRYLGGDPTAETSRNWEEMPATTIFDHLASLVIEYFDPGSGDVPAEWVREWNARDLGRLPTAISLTLIARGMDGAARSRQLVVPVVAQPFGLQPNFTDPFEGQRRGGVGIIPSTRK